MDRMDLQTDVPAVKVSDLNVTSGGENSASVAARVATARRIQSDRFAKLQNPELIC